MLFLWRRSIGVCEALGCVCALACINMIGGFQRRGKLLFFLRFRWLSVHRWKRGGRMASLWRPRRELLLERDPNIVRDVRVAQDGFCEPPTRQLLKLLAIAIQTVSDV